MPSRHIEASTKAGYPSYLSRHFYPYFGNRPMGNILPSHVQEWVTSAAANGLSAASIRKYHMMLHSVFRRAVRDRVIIFNPCEETELPKVIARRARTLTPQEYRRVVDAVPQAHRLMVTTAIETGLRWGELIALRPRHLDSLRGLLTVEETNRRSAAAGSPGRAADDRQALPQRQRTPHPRPTPPTAARTARPHPGAQPHRR